MNFLFKMLAIIFAVHTVISTATADDLSFGQPNISIASWEQHSEGVALALTLNTQTEKGVHKSVINVYIKNTSDTNKTFIVSGADSGIRIYYIDGQGAQVTLHNYTIDDEITERI